jgi:hypothetical protein
VLTKGRLHPSRSTQEAYRELDGAPLLKSHVVCANPVLWAEGEGCCGVVSGLIPKLWPERQANGSPRIAPTCNPEGAWEPGSKPKWRTEYTKSFSDKAVVLFEDNDAPGRTLAEYVSVQNPSRRR